MEQFIMKGGNPLVGEVTIGGAKNAALGILAASIMTDEDVLIENLPDVRDINVLLEAIQEIGASVDRIDRHTVKINASDIHEVSVDDEYIRRIRASYYFIGALLGKYKSAQVPLPGGCNIGSRPIDLHIKGFRALGAKVEIERGAVLAHAIDLVGSHIYLDKVSVGATINIMMAAALAEGQTIIENVAKEPHVVDVANFLNSMGANIKGAGTDIIRIKGVRKLHGTEYSIIPDQIEAGTFMRASSSTYLKRFSKMLSVTMLVPSASARVTVICGCISVGNPGYGRVLMLVCRCFGLPTTRTASSNSTTSQPISNNFAEIASRCFGITFLTVISPRVAAAAHIKVPASI
jgi:UDP-N-acetylglucosamine 1-carboxyvinyltransferase